MSSTHPSSTPWRCLDCGAIFDSHWAMCGYCFAAGSLVPMARRRQAQVDGTMEVTSARDLLRAAWQSVGSSAYPELQLRHGAMVVVTGPPGAGKSTFATRLLDGISGPVVYASVEEPPGPSLAARLQRLAVKRDDFLLVGRTTLDQLVELLTTRRTRALAIDSVQPSDLSPRELRHLLNVLPSLEVLVGVAQVNARGVIAGERSLEHEADAVVRVEDGAWVVTKSRYQQNGEGGLVTKGAS